METRYRIEGAKPLEGEVVLSGAKNATLPCMCAALLTEEEVILRNVPDIADVRSLLDIFSYIGVEYTFADHVLSICAKNIESHTISHELVCKFRASILLLGPLLARCGEVRIAYPGGCVLGKRPVDAHIDALVQLGAQNLSTEDMLHLRGSIRGGEIVLPEFSVTATENVLLACVGSSSETAIHIAAAEPHVQDLCNCLVAMGAHIGGIGTHSLTIHGTSLHGGHHTVTNDYLEAGFFALSGLLTGGNVKVRGARENQLHSFLKSLVRMGAEYSFPEKDLLEIRCSELKATTVRTNIFPGFPTDLQAAMGVVMTQAHGVSRIFERLFEGRLAYLYELEKMGAHIEILNAHEALIIGPTPLRGRTVTSNDIRAGAAMVLAALCARGETLITDVQYIERGYENLIEKLRSIGAGIERVAGNELDSGYADLTFTQREGRGTQRKGHVTPGVSA